MEPCRPAMLADIFCPLVAGESEPTDQPLRSVSVPNHQIATVGHIDLRDRFADTPADTAPHATTTPPPPLLPPPPIIHIITCNYQYYIEFTILKIVFTIHCDCCLG